MNPNQENCYCGSKNTYNNCCGIAHTDINKVKTAEALMRSRYSAFVLADGKYLAESQHSSTRPKTKKEIDEIVKWAKSVKWLKLEIKKVKKGTENDNEGTVEFIAYFFEGSYLNTLKEKSYFVKENGHWVYVDRAV